MKLNELMIGYFKGIVTDPISTLYVLAILAIIASNIGYIDNEGSIEFLNGMHYSNIEIIGSSFYGCGKSMETFRTKFKATDSRGIRVEGVVCKGLFGGSTIRFKSFTVSL